MEVDHEPQSTPPPTSAGDFKLLAGAYQHYIPRLYRHHLLWSFIAYTP
jgi:hypothetical protein